MTKAIAQLQARIGSVLGGSTTYNATAVWCFETNVHGVKMEKLANASGNIAE